MIPFKAESVESMRKRFPESIRETYDRESISLGNAMPANMQRKHVFDFEDGTRLIATREYIKETSTYVVHISGTVLRRSETCTSFQNDGLSPTKALAMIVGHCKEVREDFESFRFAGLTPGLGIPAWYKVVTQDEEGNDNDERG